MKKNKKIEIIFLILIIMAVIIPTIMPKSNAKIIKVEEGDITTFSEEKIGKTYEYGTPITINDDYEVRYIDTYGSTITTYYYYKYSSPEDNYVGFNYSCINLRDYSKYWIVRNIYKTCSYKIIVFQQINFNECYIADVKIGDVCYNDDLILNSKYYCNIVYKDQNNNTIWNQDIYQNYYQNQDISYSYQDNPYSWINEYRIGENEEIQNVSNEWEVIEAYNTSGCEITFAPPKETKELQFELTCDKEMINKQEKTTCHLSAKNYMITEQPIVLDFESNETLEILDLIPNEYFTVNKNNNTITIQPNYISTTPENIELFSFEVKATKDNGEENNVILKNIKYNDDENYPVLATTIKIEDKNNILSNNPLTKSQTTFLKIILIELLLIISMKLLFKKKSV